jgi:hypothetical protein
MSVDSESAGILVAVGFLAMAVVSMPIAAWFVAGCLVLGGIFALLLRFAPRRLAGVLVGTAVLLVAAMLWWAGRPPQRPHGVSIHALHVEPTTVGFTLHKPGYWLECSFDEIANVDHCKLADAKGTGVFEDEFVPCTGQGPVPQGELVFNARKTGSTWTRSSSRGIDVPVVFLEHGQILLPRSFDAAARKAVCPD